MFEVETRHPLDYFGTVIVINLQSRPDRKIEMEAEFHKIGYSTSKVVWFEAVRPQDKGAFESIGARGCFMSHLSVLKSASLRKSNRLLILEDDCSFVPDFVSRLHSLVHHLGTRDWDMLYGGGVPDRPQPAVNGLSEIPADCGILTTHSVAFNGYAIEKTLAYIERQLFRPVGHPDGAPSMSMVLTAGPGANSD